MPRTLKKSDERVGTANANGRVEVVRRSARRDRLTARVPRLVAGTLAVVMIVAGVRSTIAGPPVAPPLPPPPALPDQAGQAFAEAFARSYLSWDPGRPELQEQAVGRYLSDELDPGAGVQATQPQQVLWTAAVGSVTDGSREVVTVAVATDRGDYHLAVPVARNGAGLLAVVDYPALVGAPPVALDRPAPAAEDVEDRQLRAVAERVVRNYLAGESQNLKADLDPAAVVSLPDRQLTVQSVDEITQAGPRKVAVQVQAKGERTVWTLAYELAVVRHERWYVHTIAGDPRATTRRTK